LFEDGAHRKGRRERADGKVLDGGGERGQLAGNRRFVNIVADPHAQAGKQGVISTGNTGDLSAVPSAHEGGDVGQNICMQWSGVLDDRLATRDVRSHEPLIRLQNSQCMGRSMLRYILQNSVNAIGRQLSIHNAQFEKLSGELLDLFFARGHARKSTSVKDTVASRQTLLSSRAAVSL
jgi:hypothetical protein